MPVQEEEHECPPEFTDWWIFSYGDLVTLLLCFFIMLFSFCKTDTEKFKSVAESFKPTPPGSPFFLSGQPSVLEQLAKNLESCDLFEGALITVEDRGVVISFKDSVLFQPGSANLTDSARGTLRIFSRFLLGLPNDVLIEGHTDDSPITSARYPSNWDLSSARSSSVARFLESEGVEGQRMQVVGLGQYHPQFRNDTELKRALNRRIDVVLKP